MTTTAFVKPSLSTARRRTVVRMLLFAAALVSFLTVQHPAAAATSGRVILFNKTFRCGDYSQPLRLELLRVTIRRPDGGDAIGLNRGDCRGFIRRIEVRTWARDGVKVGGDAHDLVIGGGFVRCYQRWGDVHQDAIQVMGGTNVTFRHVVTRCPTSNHSSFFVNAGINKNSVPTAVVCSYCDLKGGSTTVHIGDAIASGVKNSVVYAGRFTAFRGDPATAVWRNNRVIAFPH